MRIECPNCPGYPTEQDEEGRWYSCYTCGDTGSLEVVPPSIDEINVQLRILASREQA